FMPMLFAAEALGQVLGPIFFSAAGDGGDASQMRRVSQMGRHVVYLSCAACAAATIAALVLHRPLAALMLAPEFRPWSWLLPCLVLSGGLYATGQLAVLPVISGTDTRMLIPAKVVTAVIGVALSAAAAWHLGIVGVI